MTADQSAVFPKSSRLRKRAEYLALSSSNRKVSVRGFLVVWQENHLQTARLGITASKKIGCAVVRNRVKRFTRDFFRHCSYKIACVDINVIARRESAVMLNKDIIFELTKAFKSIGMPNA